MWRGDAQRGEGYLSNLVATCEDVEHGSPAKWRNPGSAPTLSGVLSLPMSPVHQEKACAQGTPG